MRTQQISFYKIIQVSIQNSLRIMTLYTGSRILYQFVWMKNVISDLRPKINLHLTGFHFISFDVPPFDFDLIQF